MDDFLLPQSDEQIPEDWDDYRAWLDGQFKESILWDQGEIQDLKNAGLTEAQIELVLNKLSEHRELAYKVAYKRGYDRRN